MHHLSRVVPASVVGVAGVAAGVDALLLHRRQLLVAQTLLNIEQLLGDLVLVGMAHDADARVPRGLLRAQEVAINLVFDLPDGALDIRVLRVRVVLPAREASLVASVVLLAVMD